MKTISRFNKKKYLQLTEQTLLEKLEKNFSKTDFEIKTHIRLFFESLSITLRLADEIIADIEKMNDTFDIKDVLDNKLVAQAIQTSKRVDLKRIFHSDWNVQLLESTRLLYCFIELRPRNLVLKLDILNQRKKIECLRTVIIIAEDYWIDTGLLLKQHSAPDFYQYYLSSAYREWINFVRAFLEAFREKSVKEPRFPVQLPVLPNQIVDTDNQENSKISKEVEEVLAEYSTNPELLPTIQTNAAMFTYLLCKKNGIVTDYDYEEVAIQICKKFYFEGTPNPKYKIFKKEMKGFKRAGDGFAGQSIESKRNKLKKDAKQFKNAEFISKKIEDEILKVSQGIPQSIIERFGIVSEQKKNKVEQP